MKKVKTPIEATFKMPRLYIEDLNEIEGIFKEIKPTKYKIEADGFEYESINDIKAKKKLNNVTVSSYEPFIWLRLYEKNAYIRTDSDDVLIMGLVKKISNIIQGSERQNLHFMLYNKWVFIVLFSLIGLRELFVFFKAPIDILIIFLIISILALISSFTLLYLSTKVRYSVINLKSREEEVSFLQRNKDQIFLVLLGALAGAIVTYIGKKLLGILQF